METRPAKPPELARWAKVQGWIKAISMQNKLNAHKKNQIFMGIDFCLSNNILINQTSVIEEHTQNVQKEIKLWRISGDVWSGKIGISFPQGVAGQMDLVGPLDINDDEIQSYQFSGVLVIVGGILIITGLTLKVIELYERVAKTEQNEDIALDFIQKEIIAKPDLETKWEAYKQTKGWYQEQSAIDALRPSIDDLVDTLKKPLAVGIAWGIPVILAIVGLYFLVGRK